MCYAQAALHRLSRMDTPWSREVAVRLYISDPHMIHAADPQFIKLNAEMTMNVLLPSGVCDGTMLDMLSIPQYVGQ